MIAQSERATRWPQEWQVPSDRDLAEQAKRIISEMCHGDRWHMSIPAQPTDSDIVLAEVLCRFIEYAASRQDGAA